MSARDGPARDDPDAGRVADGWETSAREKVAPVAKRILV